MRLDCTVYCAESLESEVKGSPETQIFADGARKSVLFDLGRDIIPVIVHKRFPPVGETEFRCWTRTVHRISKVLGDAKWR